MRILTVVGARPQFIKAAAVSRALRGRPGVVEVLVHTGQHYDADMSDVFFDELDIPRPDFHLGVGSGPHGAQTGRMLEALERVLVEQRPDCVLVYGDTNSTLAGALAAAKLHVPVAHVEAGLRSFNRRMPEEINRVVADHLSTILFAPTETAVANLRREGSEPQRIHVVGDVMYDVALYCAERAECKTEWWDSLCLHRGGYVLATVHRAENTDDPERLRNIFEGLAAASREAPVVVPLHPRARKCLDGQPWASALGDAMRLIGPVGYLEMVLLEKNAGAIATDSGGVQKEALFHGVPCVTLRDETEWTELVEAGANRLCPPTSAEAVARGVAEGLGRAVDAGLAARLYGGGNAAARVAAVLETEAGRLGAPERAPSESDPAVGRSER